MKKKLYMLQLFRFLTQLIFLILLPGLFTLTFGELKQIYLMIIGGNFNFSGILPQLIEVITVMVITILFGRFFCGWLCAFGAFNDFIHIAAKKLLKTDIKISEKLDSILKKVKYLVLLLIIYFIWSSGSQIFAGFSPWDAFGQLINFPNAVSRYGEGFIVLLLIAVGAVFIERFFCRYLCPLGAIFSLFSMARIFKIKKPADKCGKCRLCTNSCSMGIDLYKHNKVNSGECIQCLKCINTCPRGNTQLSIFNEDLSPTLASSIAIAAFLGIYSAGNMLASNAAVNNSAVSSAAGNYSSVSSSLPAAAENSNTNTDSSQNIKYKDGTYSGSGVGYNPGLEVQVTIKNSKITNIEIVSSNDTPRYFDYAKSIITDEIIQSQSTSVDAVSGATFSSKGLMDAVQSALNKAKM